MFIFRNNKYLKKYKKKKKFKIKVHGYPGTRSLKGVDKVGH